MKIKAVEIARCLGISKATVSLALNGKPGVSEKTRQEVLKCRDLMERGELTGERDELLPESLRSSFAADQAGASAAVSGGAFAGTSSGQRTILVMVVTRGLEIGTRSEMDLWTDVAAVYERAVRKRGFTLSILYTDILTDSVEDAVRRANAPEVAGVILNGTELTDEDQELLRGIEKPMVLSDIEAADAHHNCVVPDNYKGVQRATEYLFEMGHSDILYLKQEKDIYNFYMRRRGFENTMLARGINPWSDKRIIPMGTKIETVYRKMLDWLEHNKLPEAFIMENYQISIGVIRALRKKKIRVPEDVSLIGVDAVPSYITGDIDMTTVRIPHTERALMVMALLDKEMEELSDTKSRVLTDCPLIEGTSVLDRR